MYRITSIGEILFDVYPARKFLGGAPFNFIYHVIKLTGSGNFISRIGKDVPGKEILDFLGKNNISAEFIQTDPDHPTGESIANLDEEKIPSWEIKTGSAYDFIEMNKQIESLIDKKTDCLYFGTLAQRSITTQQTIDQCFKRDLKYFCDLNIRQNFYTKNLVKLCLQTCNVLKLNIEELHLVNKLLYNTGFDTFDTPKRILNDYKIELLCITYGEQGSAIYQGGRNNHCKLKTENVIDTVGAGDAYAAILCVGYLRNWEIEKINKVASGFAGEIVKIKGALPANLEIYEKYKQIIGSL